MANIRIKEIPVSRFAILMVDRPKDECGENTANAGYFGPYEEGTEEFTLPAGHLVCDYAAESEWVRHYCEERGSFDGDKFRFDSSTWSYKNEFYGKAVSTLIVKDGRARIEDVVSLPEADYALIGVPVVRNGGDCKWGAYVTKQGWSSGTVRATWHNFVGIKNDPGTIYLIAMKTVTNNMVQSSEVYNTLQPMGFRDVIKVDGGMSFYFDFDGERIDTGGDRRLNTVFYIRPETPEPKKPFRIALDAGHGLNTPGRRIPKELNAAEVREWQLNSRAADKTEQLLRSYDNVEILRVDDRTGQKDVSLADRVNAANQWGADVYISFHHNAGVKGGDGGGIVAYAYTSASSESLNLRDALYYELVSVTGLRGNRASPRATANHYVTRETTMTAVLLELGFMDSRADVPIILTERFADGCAAAITDTLADFYGLVETDPIEQADIWAAEAWQKAYKEGVLDGTRPRDGVSRQELAVVLAKLNLI